MGSREGGKEAGRQGKGGKGRVVNQRGKKGYKNGERGTLSKLQNTKVYLQCASIVTIMKNDHPDGILGYRHWQ